jgi:hypothetical protein
MNARPAAALAGDEAPGDAGDAMPALYPRLADAAEAKLARMEHNMPLAIDAAEIDPDIAALEIETWRLAAAWWRYAADVARGRDPGQEPGEQPGHLSEMRYRIALDTALDRARNGKPPRWQEAEDLREMQRLGQKPWHCAAITARLRRELGVKEPRHEG